MLGPSVGRFVVSCPNCVACHQCVLGPIHMLRLCSPSETSEPHPGPRDRLGAVVWTPRSSSHLQRRPDPVHRSPVSAGPGPQDVVPGLPASARTVRMMHTRTSTRGVPTSLSLPARVGSFSCLAEQRSELPCTRCGITPSPGGSPAGLGEEPRSERSPGILPQIGRPLVYTFTVTPPSQLVLLDLKRHLLELRAFCFLSGPRTTRARVAADCTALLETPQASEASLSER